MPRKSKSNISKEKDTSSPRSIFQRLGLTPAAWVNNRFVEFFVERYVNWTAEAQRWFKRIVWVFLIFVTVSVVGLVYLTTVDKHQKIYDYASIYRLLKKYSIRKSVQEEQLTQVRSGRGGVVQGATAQQFMGIMEDAGVKPEEIHISELEMSEEAEDVELVAVGFQIDVKKLTYPNVVQAIWAMESLGKNVYIAELKVAKVEGQKGYYGLSAQVVVREPVLAESQ